MRKIIWVFIALVCLLPVTYIGYALLKASPKKLNEAKINFITINQQHVNGQSIDVTTLPNGDANAEFVRIFGDYLNNLGAVNRRQEQVKNNLVIIAQPQNMTNPRTIYELQEKQVIYDKEIASIGADTETAVQQLISKVSALDKKELKIENDIVSFTKTFEDGKPEREKIIQQYASMSQYIKALLEFAKSRNGFYQLGQDGALHFNRPEDQQYYAQMVSSINQLAKRIDSSRDEANKLDRQWVNGLANSLNMK